WDSAHNKALIAFMPEVYRTGNEEDATTAFMVFTGEHTVFPPGPRGFQFRAAVDGVSNTLLAFHAGGGVRAEWTRPDNIEFNEAAPRQSLGFVNGKLEGVLLDCSLISLPYDIPAEVVAGLVTPQGDELIDGPGLARRYANASTAMGA